MPPGIKLGVIAFDYLPLPEPHHNSFTLSNPQYPVANMKLSIALSMGLALLPDMATAAGGFYNSCRNNVGSISSNSEAILLVSSDSVR